MLDDQEKIKIAREYFMRADQGRPDILELFQEDVEVYFPKFGFGFGRKSFLEMVKGFEGALEFIQHDYHRLTFIPAADYLIVEGTSQGRMSGKSWAGGKTPGGRFCNVFKSRDGRISSLHIYLDPTTRVRIGNLMDVWTAGRERLKGAPLTRRSSLCSYLCFCCLCGRFSRPAFLLP